MPQASLSLQAALREQTAEVQQNYAPASQLARNLMAKWSETEDAARDPSS